MQHQQPLADGHLPVASHTLLKSQVIAVSTPVDEVHPVAAVCRPLIQVHDR